MHDEASASMPTSTLTLAIVSANPTIAAALQQHQFSHISHMQPTHQKQDIGCSIPTSTTQSKIIIHSNALNNNHHIYKNATSTMVASSSISDFDLKESLAKLPSSSSSVIVDHNGGQNILMIRTCDSNEPKDSNGVQSSTSSSNLDQADSVEIEIRDLEFDEDESEGRIFFSLH